MFKPYMRKPPAPIEQKIFPIMNWGGGLNNVNAETEIADNQATNCRNMMFISEDLMEKRYGTSLVDNLDLTSPITWVDEYKPINAEPVLVRATDTEIYFGNTKLDDVGGTIIGTNYMGKYYYADGHKLKVYDGTTFYEIMEDPKGYAIQDSPVNVPGVTSDVETQYDFASMVSPQMYGIGIRRNLWTSSSGDRTSAMYYKVLFASDPSSNVTADGYSHWASDAAILADGWIPLNSYTLIDCTADMRKRYVQICRIYTVPAENRRYQSRWQEIVAYPCSDQNIIYVDTVDNRVKVGDTVQHENVDGITKYTVMNINTTTNQIMVSETISKFIDTDDLIRYYVPHDKTNYTYGEEKYDATVHKAWYQPCDFELDDAYKSENYVPKNPKVLCIRRDRLYVAGDAENPNTVYFSDISNTLYFPIKASLSIPPNGDPIIDAIEFDSALILATHHDYFVVYGNDIAYDGIDPIRLKRMDAHTGLIAQGAYAILNNYLYYLGYDYKFYRMSTPQANIEYLTTRPMEEPIDLFKAPISLAKTDFTKINTIVYNNEFLMSVGQKVIIYSYRNKGFTHFEGWKNTQLYTDSQNLYIGDVDGKLSKWDKSVYNDLGRAIDATYETKRFNIGRGANYKYFEKCNMTTHAFDGVATDITLGYELDYYQYTTSLTAIKAVRSAKSVFGVSNFGDQFNQNSVMNTYWQNIFAKGRSIKFKLSNAILDQPMRIYELYLIWSLRDIR